MAMTEMFAEVRLVRWPVWLALHKDLPARLVDRLLGTYRSWRTARLLSQLDRITLEDIGVPHNQMSADTGTLNRYPEIIKIRQLGI